MTRMTGAGMILGGWVWVLGSTAAAAEPDTRRVSVTVDTSDVGAEGPVVKRRIRERTDVVLRSEGFLPAEPDTRDPVVHVDVDELAEPDPGYAFEMWVVWGEEQTSGQRRVECNLCTESEIVERVEATLGELLSELDELAVAAGVDEQTAQEADASQEPVVTPPPEEPNTGVDRRPLGGLGKAGIGVMAAGLAGVAVGSVLMALPPRVDDQDPLYETTTQAPGIGVLAGGAVALIGGAIMLALDRRKAKRGTTARWSPGPGLTLRF